MATQNSSSTGRSEPACPTNGRVGAAVDTQTVKALLALPLTQLRSQSYRYCAVADCPTVYYSADGAQCFDETDLRERVFHKHHDENDVLVCYCFRHSVGSIRDELRRAGHATTVEAITAGIRAEQCACDIRNPQGRCCLGNVRALIAQLSDMPSDAS